MQLLIDLCMLGLFVIVLVGIYLIYRGPNGNP